MLRFTTSVLAALAISLPLSALAAEPAVDQKAPEAVIVAASEDAVILPAPSAKEEQPAKRTLRRVAHGSSQSDAGFRFTNPYSVPPQSLPMQLPNFGNLGF
jgi:hypothetical protein